ncbi:hypothetical protein BT96DRAFT_990161 [Gymnopus androsaceus JB14]|uniref:RING-type domain-containing protein n=1 Tax=Gymnopus androsaceus JB14 TaxID=1447944 RepID=A0A6A4HZN0_9AGAR|nr:hypothetical protein BT96DRAFT_990161 [Gymnopus androsaceus JB14]
MATCSICLSDLQDPVCTPCGHIYCSQCLSFHILAARVGERDTVKCPTCRVPFPIVTPELTTLPKHVQRFITPSVRRVYIDTTHSQALQRQLTRAKSQIRELVKESQDLQASNLSKKRKLEEVDGVVNRLAKSHCQLLEQYSLKKSKLQEAGDVTQEWKERYNDLLEANVAKKRELARANSEAAEWKRKYEALFKLPVKLAKSRSIHHQAKARQ